MNANSKGAYSLILPLVILISLFNACSKQSKPNHHAEQVISTSQADGTKIDSSSWLKDSRGIRGIFEDSKGNLWFSSTDFVCVLDVRQDGLANPNDSVGRGSNITYFSEEDGLRGTGMVHEDQNGTIWVECGFEAYSYDGDQFSSHPLKPDTTGNKWAASDNDIWFQKGIERFGNTEGPPGVYRYHNGEIDFLAFPVPETGNNDNIYHPTTRAIKGKDGTTWFGTMEVVIGFNDGSLPTGQAGFTLIDREKMGRMDDPGPVGIRGLCVDSKGNLWMADNGSGVFVYDGDSTINFTKLHHLGKEDTNGNTLHRAFSIAEDDAGNMWFGTVYSGIWRYDVKSTGQAGFTNYSEEDGVISDNIWTIYKTKKGELLFGGENPGAVYKFNGTSFDRVY